MRRARAAGDTARGQSLMELAIGMLMLVTVILVGMHLAEVSFLSLKTNEAANLALWQSAGRRVHQFDRDSAAGNDENVYTPFHEEILASASPGTAFGVTHRYEDFDGREARNRRPGITQLVTQAADGVEVTCEADPQVRFSMSLSGRRTSRLDDPYLDAVRGVLRGLYRGDEGGMRCGASAELAMLRGYRRFLDRDQPGAFFKEAQWNEPPLRLCAAGRARGRRCPGSYGILLGDWALDGPRGYAANDSTMHPDGRNDRGQPYRRLIERIYEANGASRGDAASRFAEKVGGEPSPHDERHFYMSYAGIEWLYEDWDYERGDEWRDPDEIYPTGGIYEGEAPRTNPANSYMRNPCYLGLPCYDD